ncbi:hypothetical protein ETU08_04525 [Apibacter muscae]|uniref:Uncharacterized protein n=1 Tax=Apibacter muscae TaxID=2509004 RepID=A0A563DFN9_9FLAO|nr:DUF6755 family protein [Apibacter muscae]TWP29056.1 hypothetical protein ETU09_04235 [Apibacter muscae]TWP30363.1 hypothetical protein ETU08_04525 [Apibacter muscae]
MKKKHKVNNPVNPSRMNTLTSAIIVIFILILALQIWLMYGALNNALDGNHGFAWATFIASLFLFISSLFLLKYLPASIKNKENKKSENQYE